jgi:hypothetical protein
MNYEFHPEAELEVIEAAARYDAAVPGLGERFGDEVERVIELLLERPELGARVIGEIRHFVLQRFPFSIIYVVLRSCSTSSPSLTAVEAPLTGSRDSSADSEQFSGKWTLTRTKGQALDSAHSGRSPARSRAHSTGGATP